MTAKYQGVRSGVNAPRRGPRGGIEELPWRKHSAAATNAGANTVSMSSQAPTARPRWRRAARAFGLWLAREQWLLLVFAAALIVRLHWNLHVHPLGDYVYSDMNGYVSRADRMLKMGFAAREYNSFFPYGTHWMIAGMKWAFGKDNYDAIGVLYALFGSFTVAFAYASARRASAFVWVAPVVGLIGILYYPHFSLGGYILSEVPFSFFVMGAVLFSLRLADHGRHRDAWIMGLFAGIGAAVRPQILASAALLGVFWLIRRKALPKIRLVHLLQSFVPVVIVLGLSAVLLEHNTGRLGLVSENGSFNLVFGRCHNSKIRSTPDGQGHGRVHFRPPSFLQIKNHETRSKKKGIPPRVALNPAISDELTYPGYIGDKEKHMEYVRECIRRTGLSGQLAYSVTNATLLWRHNVPWPDSGRSQWRKISRWWTKWHRNLFAIPALLVLVTLGLRRRTIKQALLAVHLLALVLVGALFFGSIRVRTPYDFVIITLAVEAYAFGLWLIYRGGRMAWSRLQARRRAAAQKTSD